MKSVHFTWPQPLEAVEQQTVETIASQLTLDPLIVELLWRRGWQSLEMIETLLQTENPVYHDPFLLHDMQRAVDRIISAVEEQESILIYGDYDADGMTSSSILYETLEQLGAQVSYYLPNRFTDGYGPNLDVYKYFKQQGVSLIVTVDNGVSGKEAIEAIQAMGVDVIVTDHHEIPAELPSAYAIVHPRHPKGTYPFGDLSGAGVAFKVAHALTGELPMELLDLAAIGTVADLVSLTDENRTLVKQGIQLMNHSLRMGIQSLLEASGIQAGQLIDEQTIGFKIAPRLNSLGRLDDPNPAVSLLTALDSEVADEIAQQMEQVNQQRVDLVEQVTERCATLLEEKTSTQPLPKIIVLYEPDFHVGILGIVASRLVDRYARPVILLGDGSNSGEIKGSGRSIPSINLYQLLQEAASSIMYFGGHAGAAGLTMKKDQLHEMIKLLERALDDVSLDDLVIEESIDLNLPIERLTIDFVNQLKAIGPYGMGFTQPLIGIESIKLKDGRTMGVNQAHFKAKVDHPTNDAIEVLGFNWGDNEKQLSHAHSLKIIGELDLNKWRGEETPQIRLKGYELMGKIWLDERKSKLDPQLLQLKQTLFIYETEKIGDVLKEKLDATSEAISYNELNQVTFDQTFDRQIFLECPLIPLITRYDEPLKFHSEEIWVVMHRFYRYLERSMPKIEEFKRLYKIIYQKNTLSFEQVKELETTLNLKISDLKWMINVFYELKFVTIESGQIVRVDKPVQQPIDSSKLYQQRLQAIEEERFYQFQPLEKIMNVLTN
ncbi:single-stranded-DNA-specific exonuclease RecJ [Atopobacter phocae]|uniref:single-stranded-DNA-specific exonuclease RecJ n=1 Tax=Atopobacter phocae TaxID=136492 RepID=UPI000472E858|nr:single-stranded-DNA-specific exonuclease RecJ [Atopobacter phocae]